MNKQDVLEFVEDNGIKFIRLGFCDIFGKLKNVSINANELNRAFEYGISFDASSVEGFLDIEESDLLLFPDPNTLRLLPWRPHTGGVIFLYCDIKKPDGTPFEGDGRYILKQTVRTCKQYGYVPQIGSECEFYLFEMDDHNRPTMVPNDEAGYCDVAPLDAGENIRREICLNLEDMGIQPEYSHHEQGPGQHEIVFKYNQALKAADNLVSFKACVKAIASQNGLFASFMPKPLKNASGSGLHINISLKGEKDNIFDSDVHNMSEDQKYFIAGVLNRAKDVCAILSPLTNSYKRLGKDKAPKYITWSKGNRSQFIRIPSADKEYSRIEIRSADGCCNPYLAFSLLIAAGLEGIKNKEELPNPVDENLYVHAIEGLEVLPENLGEAIAAMENSDFVKGVLPKDLLEKYLEAKKEDWHAHEKALNEGMSCYDFEKKKYFKYM